MLKLNLQYFGHMMQRSDCLEKTPDAGKDWRQEEKETRRWDGWMASPTQWTWVWASSKSWWWTGRPGMLQSTGLQRVRYYWATELTERSGLLWVRPGYLYPILRHQHLLWSPVSLPSKPSCTLQSDRSFKNANLTVSNPFLLPPPHHAELWPISMP